VMGQVCFDLVTDTELTWVEADTEDGADLWPWAGLALVAMAMILSGVVVWRRG